MEAKQVKPKEERVPLLKDSKYIDPLSDWGFKRLFGSEPDKEILIDFLNALFEGEKQIVDLVYSPTEYSGESKETSKVFFDLNCTGADGENFLIEMQRGEQLYFSDRAVFYVSRLVSEQFKKGESDWKRRGLKEVYLIGLLEFVLSSNTDKRYLRNIALTDRETGEVFYSKLGYKFIELPNFIKTDGELVTEMDKWLYLLKHLSTLKKIPAFLNRRIFQRVFKIAEVANLTDEERIMYNASLKSKTAYDGSIAFAEQKAYLKGKEEMAGVIAFAEQKAYLKGKEEMAGVVAVAEQKAYLKGKEEVTGLVAVAEQKAYLKGKEEMTGLVAVAEDKAFEKGIHIERAKAEAEKRETARTLKDIGVAVEDIARATGLSIQEIDTF